MRAEKTEAVGTECCMQRTLLPFNCSVVVTDC